MTASPSTTKLARVLVCCCRVCVNPSANRTPEPSRPNERYRFHLLVLLALGRSYRDVHPTAYCAYDGEMMMMMIIHAVSFAKKWHWVGTPCIPAISGSQCSVLGRKRRKKKMKEEVSQPRNDLGERRGLEYLTKAPRPKGAICCLCDRVVCTRGQPEHAQSTEENGIQTVRRQQVTEEPCAFLLPQPQLAIGVGTPNEHCTPA